MSRHLMAKMRRTAGNLFDWQQTQVPDISDFTKLDEVHRARLENGHELHAWRDHDGTFLNPDDPEENWNWSISDPSSPAVKEYADKWTPENAWDAPPVSAGGGEWESQTPLTASTLAVAGAGEVEHYPKYFKRWLPDHEPPVVVHTNPISSLDEAKVQAEAAYQKMYPIGTDTGPRDSGVDYSDLNRFMGEL